jgi:GNAT superfamily N-acetyltransferase
MNTSSALPKTVGDGLILREVSSPDDVQRYIDLNAAVTNEGAIAKRLLHHHPTTTNADYWLVVDETTGKAASTTCLLPWRCNLDGIVLNVAMLEMVVTDPAYRKRGLVRAQIEHFHAVVAERGFDLSIIQGIPYYYRQYGYGYAVDHTPLTALAAYRIPEPSANTPSPYLIRSATVADVANLTRLYDAALAQHQLAVQRSAADWRYLLEHKSHPVQLVTAAQTDCALGYFVAPGQGEPLRIYEHALPDYVVGLALLQALKETGCGEIQLAGPVSDQLVGLVCALGGMALPVADQWLWRIPRVAALLSRLAPVLEERLATAGCGHFTGTLRLNLYRQAYALQLQRGTIKVEELGFVDASLGADGGDLCIPPEAFMRLVLGYRSLAELRDSWPDLVIKPAARYLIEALFPRLDAHILMPY